MAEDFRGGQPLKNLFFGDNLFRIPEFQRDYAWTQAEVSDLLNDLGVNVRWDASHSPSFYFLGQIVLLRDDADGTGYRHEPVAGFKVPDMPQVGTTADIVDGQQRITTLTILFACLRDRLAAPDERDAMHALIEPPHASNTAAPDNSPCYVLELASQLESAFMRRSVQAPGATLGAEHAQDTVGRVTPDDDAPLKLLKQARHQIAAAVAAMNPDERAALAHYLRDRCLVAVVVTSNRDSGWDVFSRLNKRGRPLLESERLKADILSTVEEPRRGELVHLWDQRKRLLGASFDAGDARRKDLFSHIRDHYTASGGRTEDRILALAKSMGAERFIDDVFEPMSRALGQIALMRFINRDGSLQPEVPEFAQRLQGLELVGRVMSQSSIEVQDAWKAPVLLFLTSAGDDMARKLKFVRGFDRYLHLLLILHGKRNKANIGRQLAHLNAQIAEHGDTLDLDRAFQLPNIKQVIHNLTTALDGTVAKLILLRVAGETDGLKMQEAATYLGNAYNIEHVLPEKITESWSHMFAGDDIAREMRGNIGNLYITNQKLNSKLGNKAWAEKRRLLRHATVLLPLGFHVRNAARWDKEAIITRQNEIVAAIDQLWGLTGPVRDRPVVTVETTNTDQAAPSKPRQSHAHKKRASMSINRPRREFPPRIRAKRRNNPTGIKKWS